MLSNTKNFLSSYLFVFYMKYQGFCTRNRFKASIKMLFLKGKGDGIPAHVDLEMLRNLHTVLEKHFDITVGVFMSL